ncbi:MAG: nucleotidyltransferase family protein [Clostridia bacterium]|nr:nucleotidyltransferase family protein [Clostridia bacterium]
MKEKEKRLFKALCKFKESAIDSDMIEFATPSVLGHLFFNRMQGVAYDTLKKSGLLGNVNREFRNSLGAAYYQNVQKNQSFRQCVVMLSEILSHCNCNAAMLKGAYLCAHYPDGYRTSNDVDLLVLPKDVTTIGNLLTAAGFKQGNIRNGEFIPATRQEIIESKMMRGETIPYIKEVNLPFMRFFEVDINFSLDYKNSNGDTLSSMLSNVRIINEKELSILTLSNEDFFIHLCSHLYKEATTLPWIKMYRDMTLYKYCDIYLLLSEMTDNQLYRVFNRAKELGLEKICAYAILETIGLFDMNNSVAYNMAIEAIADEPDFCLKVVSPKDKKMYIYQTADVNERFFMESRENDLKEVFSNEKT